MTNTWTVVGSKVITFGKQAVFSKRKINEIVLHLELRKDGEGRPVFSASGDVWNGSHSDIIAGGQCIDTIALSYYKPIANDSVYKLIWGLWERNHLNNCVAGSPKQETAIKKYLKTNADSGYNYDDVVKMLKKKRLYKDKSYLIDGKPYVYGSKWLYREISENDLKEINRLLNCGASKYVTADECRQKV